MWIIYTLSALWSIGCLALFLFILKQVVFPGYGEGPNWLGIVMVLGLALPIIVLIGLLPWAYIEYDKSPDLATLKKAEWWCSVEHPETTTTYVQSGKVMVPVTTTTMVCDQYNKR